MAPSSETIDKRKDALELYHQGMRVSDICCRLKRSRAWFYIWLRRYESGDPKWFEDKSKAPHTVANKTPKELIKLVLRIRQGLESTPGARIGASKIQIRMADLGWEPLPKRTINRILKQYHPSHNRAPEKRRKQPCRKKTQKTTELPFRQLPLF